MSVPDDVAERGLRAYEQAGAFQQLRRRRGLRVFYALAPMLMLGFGYAAGELGYAALAYGFLAAAIFSVVFTVRHWKNLRRRYEENVALLARLEAEYGDELPWIEVEKHMEALRRFMAEPPPPGLGGRTSIEIGGKDDEPPMLG